MVDLPEEVEPGRYRVLSAAVLNGRIALCLGDILWDDGTHRCEIGTERVQRRFALAAQTRDASTHTLIDEAVCAVVEQARAGALPSPIMPANLGRHSGLLELEIRLDELLKAGHLQNIARRPRLDMRYDEEVLPLSRAKRLAPDALTRLASHSEDWHRRSLAGIVPARVMSLISEDEYAVYENVVFARLIDRLENLLQQRISEVDTLRRKHEQALNLANAENLDRRLRESLCTLWGQSFEETADASASAADTLQALQRLLRTVRQLRFGDLYPRVPRNTRLPPTIKTTNILRHDAHYRHLPPIWDLAHAACRERIPTPEEKYALARAAGESYAKFVELLVRRALRESFTVQWRDSEMTGHLGAWRVELRSESDGECTLALIDGEQQISELTFVAGWRGELPWEEQCETRYLVFCHSSQAGTEHPGACEDSVLNPLQFYSVERIRLAIEKWLLKEVLGRYPFCVSPVPGDLMSALSEIPGVRASGSAIEVPELLGATLIERVKSTIAHSAANVQTKRNLEHALELNRLLRVCRVCGTHLLPASFRASAQGFKARCQACEAETTLKLRGRKPVEAEVGGHKRGFPEVGWREFHLNWTPPHSPRKVSTG